MHDAHPRLGEFGNLLMGRIDHVGQPHPVLVPAVLHEEVPRRDAIDVDAEPGVDDLVQMGVHANSRSFSGQSGELAVHLRLVGVHPARSQIDSDSGQGIGVVVLVDELLRVAQNLVDRLAGDVGHHAASVLALGHRAPAGVQPDAGFEGAFDHLLDEGLGLAFDEHVVLVGHSGDSAQ